MFGFAAVLMATTMMVHMAFGVMWAVMRARLSRMVMLGVVDTVPDPALVIFELHRASAVLVVGVGAGMPLHRLERLDAEIAAADICFVHTGCHGFAWGHSLAASHH